MKKKLLSFLMSRYKDYKQKRSNLSQKHVLTVAKEMLKKSRYVLLLTNSSGNAPSARVVQPVLEENDPFFTIWVGTRAGSRKIQEIEADDLVTLVVQDDSRSAQLILKGRASIESDNTLRRKYWQGVWRMFFPGGPLSDDYILVKFVPEEIEVLSFSQNVIPEPFGLKSCSLSLQP